MEACRRRSKDETREMCEGAREQVRLDSEERYRVSYLKESRGAFF